LNREEHTEIGYCSCAFVWVCSLFICSSDKIKVDDTFFRMLNVT